MMKNPHERRAMFKMVAAGLMFGFIAVLNDWSEFIGSNAVERTFRIFTWAFTFFIGPVFAVKLPQKHRLFGWAHFFIALFCVLAWVGMLAFAHSQVSWRWPARAILAGFGAFVFLLDRDVRRYRAERSRMENHEPDSENETENRAGKCAAMLGNDDQRKCTQ